MTPDPIEQKLCALIGAVESMRMHQRAYFAYRAENDKRKAITAEKRVDQIIIRLKQDGYKPIVDDIEQSKLF